MASRPPGSRSGSRDRLNEPTSTSASVYVPAAGAAVTSDTPAVGGTARSRSGSRGASQERLDLAVSPAAPIRPVPAARPASVGGYLDSEASSRAVAPPARRGSQELLSDAGPRPPPAASTRAASREALAYEPVRHHEPQLQPDPRGGAGAAPAAFRSASREQLDADSLYAPRSVPRSASREMLDRGTPGPSAGGQLAPLSYERRFQTNPSAGNLLYATKTSGDAGRSRSSSVASLSAAGRSAPPPKFSQKPYYPSYNAQRYGRPKHMSTTREPGYYNLTTDTVIRTKKHRTRTFLYVGRPWTKGFSTTPRNFLALAVVSFFFCPPLGIVALVFSVLSKRAGLEENNAAAGRYGVIAFRMSVATIIVGVICWIALIALIHKWNFIGTRIH